MKEYKMLPIKRPEGAIPIKLPRPVPTIGPKTVRKYARILSLSEDGNTAVICENMKKLENGELTVYDVDVSSLGVHSVSVGDILAYDGHDTHFNKPLIFSRCHQNHQHPKDLVAADEV